jgi:mannitol/fructose-specific phosphotransferase system IIA component (Ntr-type)
MKLLEFIPKKGIAPSLKASDRKAVVAELVTLLKKAHADERISVTDVAAAVLEREVKVGSTGLGGGVAIPHARIDGIKGVIGAFGRCPKAIDFAAVDGEPVSLFFLIISPPAKDADYAAALQKVAQVIKTQNFCKFLKAAKTAKDIEEVFRDAEEMVGV